MSVLGTIWAALTAFLGRAGAKHLRDVYVTRTRHAEKMAAIDDRAKARSEEVTGRWALSEREERIAMSSENAKLREEVKSLAVVVARCEEKHARSEDDRRETRVALDAARQLIERQRGEIEALSKSLDELRDQFDAFVRHAMGVRGISEVPGE